MFCRCPRQFSGGRIAFREASCANIDSIARTPDRDFFGGERIEISLGGAGD